MPGISIIRNLVLDTNSGISLKGNEIILVAKLEMSMASQCQKIIVPKKSKLKKAICAGSFDGKVFQLRIVNVLHKYT